MNARGEVYFPWGYRLPVAKPLAQKLKADPSLLKYAFDKWFAANNVAAASRRRQPPLRLSVNRFSRSASAFSKVNLGNPPDTRPAHVAVSCAASFG